MADIDFAELAKDPIYVGLVLGLLGIVVYFALGRKSFGPVPSRCPWVEALLHYINDIKAIETMQCTCRLASEKGQQY